MERNFTRGSHHDMERLEAGHIKFVEQEFELSEKLVDEMLVILTSKLMSVDQLRKGIESLPPHAYEKMSYYECWIFPITQALHYNGLLTTQELSRKLEEVQLRDDTEVR